MLLFALYLSWRRVKAAREAERAIARQAWLASAAGRLSLLGAFLYLAYVPVIPAAALYVFYLVIAIAWLVFVPVSQPHRAMRCNFEIL